MQDMLPVVTSLSLDVTFTSINNIVESFTPLQSNRQSFAPQLTFFISGKTRWPIPYS